MNCPDMKQEEDQRAMKRMNNRKAVALKREGKNIEDGDDFIYLSASESKEGCGESTAFQNRIKCGNVSSTVGKQK